jgi:hypothetical protein
MSLLTITPIRQYAVFPLSLHSRNFAVVNLFRNTVNDVRKLSTCLGKQVTAVDTDFLEVTILGKEQKNVNHNQ